VEELQQRGKTVLEEQKEKLEAAIEAGKKKVVGSDAPKPTIS
jgi:hypothetical protein